jgi:hypothetical protein
VRRYILLRITEDEAAALCEALREFVDRRGPAGVTNADLHLPDISPGPPVNVRHVAPPLTPRCFDRSVAVRCEVPVTARCRLSR